MEKLSKLRSLYRSIRLRSPRTIAAATASSNRSSLGFRHPFQVSIGSIRSYHEDATKFPLIRDPDIYNVLKDFMATSWEDLPDNVINDAKKALSKNTKDSSGREALANVFRAAEAVEEFGGILVTLRMAIDDVIGMSGKNIGPLPDDHAYALDEVYKRYEEYLDAFGPDEEYLRKKVESELGAKMIHLKMRCSFLDSEWGKVSVLGTSGLSGSYIEHRGP
ncbi:membrane anchor in succinate dehydrogenase complex [Ranunculus cassubicifolius]